MLARFHVIRLGPVDWRDEGFVLGFGLHWAWSSRSAQSRTGSEDLCSRLNHAVHLGTHPKGEVSSLLGQPLIEVHLWQASQIKVVTDCWCHLPGDVVAFADVGAGLDSEVRLDRLIGTRSSWCSKLPEERREPAEPERVTVLPLAGCC